MRYKFSIVLYLWVFSPKKRKATTNICTFVHKVFWNDILLHCGFVVYTPQGQLCLKAMFLCVFGSPPLTNPCAQYSLHHWYSLLVLLFCNYSHYKFKYNNNKNLLIVSFIVRHSVFALSEVTSSGFCSCSCTA